MIRIEKKIIYQDKMYLTYKKTKFTLLRNEIDILDICGAL